MTNIFRTVFVILLSVACFKGYSYAETVDSNITLTCTYTFSNDKTKKSWVSNSTFKINIPDETVISAKGTDFILTVTDAVFKLEKIIDNNTVVINIDRLTGELDGFWIINDAEYKMSGECNKKSIYLREGVIFSNLTPITD